ncbi:MAG: hypothetical protein AAF985_16175, partial [Bacteroidota bacterium]
MDIKQDRVAGWLSRALGYGISVFQQGKELKLRMTNPISSPVRSQFDSTERTFETLCPSDRPVGELMPLSFVQEN